MTNPPPVAPVEGHLYFLFAEYENTINIRKWSKEPFEGAVEYVRKSDLADLIAACDPALDWADANARAFPIETAPDNARIIAWCEHYKNWFTMNGRLHIEELKGHPTLNFTYWTPLPPPPSNPPLPAPLEALGAVLRRVKGVG